MIIKFSEGRWSFNLLQRSADHLEAFKFPVNWFERTWVLDAGIGLEVVKVVKAEDWRAYIQQIFGVFVDNIASVLRVYFVNQVRN